MFVMHILFSLALQLIALGFGALLMLYTDIHPEVKAYGCKIIAYIILLGALGSIVLTGYYTTVYWRNGYFCVQNEWLIGWHNRVMQQKTMLDGMTQRMHELMKK